MAARPRPWFLPLALLLVDAAILAVSYGLAQTVVPGWKKGPLIDPAAPYAPEHAYVLFGWIAVAVVDLYALLLVLGQRFLGRRAWLPWLALLLAWGAAELGVRAWLHAHMVTYFRPHPVLHWVVRPNLDHFLNRTGGGTITTNADGMRGVAVPREKAADEFRILVLGDSSNFGHGVDDEQVWSAVLEFLLRDAIPGKRVVVINGACPGWTTYQAVEFMRSTGLAYQPDLVLAGFNNDPGPDYFGDLERRPTGWVRAVESVLFHLETYLLGREVVLSTLRRFFPTPEVHYSARRAGENPKYGKLSPDEARGLVPRVPLEQFLDNLRTLYELGRERGYTFVWINMPINRTQPELVERYVNPAYREAAARLARELGFPLIDVDAAWRADYHLGLHLPGHVFHPSVEGHRRMALQVARFLLAHHLLPGASEDYAFPELPPPHPPAQPPRPPGGGPPGAAGPQPPGGGPPVGSGPQSPPGAAGPLPPPAAP